MFTYTKSKLDTRGLPIMLLAELHLEQRKAQGRFDQARLRKQEADYDHVDAANELNMLDRLVEKAQRRAAVEERAAARSLTKQQGWGQVRDNG